MPWTLAHPAAVLPLRRLADAGYLHKLLVRPVAYSTSAFLGLVILVAMLHWQRTRPLSIRHSARQ